jgi:hypothetical protein
MALISCGTFSAIIILPLISAIFNITNYEIFKYTGYVNHPIITSIITNTILILFFIPFLFRKFVCNKKNDITNDYKINLKMKIKYPLLITILLGILFEIYNLFHIIFSIKYHWEKPYFENDYLFELCFIHVAYKLFSTKLKYKHHIVSILFILLFAIGYIFLEDIFYKNYFILIFTIIKQFIFGVCIVFIEYIMKEKKFSMFKVLFFFGLVGLIVDLLVLIIVSNVTCADSLNGDICSSINIKIENNGIKQFLINQKYILINSEDGELKGDYYLDHSKYFYEEFKTMLDIEGFKYLIYTIIFSLCSVFSIFFCFIITRRAHPSLTFFSNIIISFYLKIREFFYDIKGEIYIIISQLILVLLILLWTLVYEELIELNFCGISDYTKNNKDKRNDLDEKRSTTWISNSILNDADVTMDK